MTKVLVTGGAGFIGSHLAEALIERGDEVVVLDNLSAGKLENLESIKNKIQFIEGDIRDLELLQEVFKGVELVFHEAAIASMPISIEDPVMTHDVNLRHGNRRLFKVRAGARFLAWPHRRVGVVGAPLRVRHVHAAKKRRPTAVAGG